jgi:hypothetical protein
MAPEHGDPEKRAMMLAVLAMTPEYALSAFRARQLKTSTVDPEELRRARELLLALGGALAGERDAGLIESLWRALPRTPPADDPSLLAPAAAAPTRAAPADAAQKGAQDDLDGTAALTELPTVEPLPFRRG